MTKEELKLEALKYLENFKDCANCKHRWGDCADELDEDCLINNCYSATPKEQNIYLAGAEPREKRIADLEEKLANADYQLEGRDLEIKELKAQIEKMKSCYNCSKWNDGQCADIPDSGYCCADFVCEEWEIKEK